MCCSRVYTRTMSNICTRDVVSYLQKKILYKCVRIRRCYDGWGVGNSTQLNSTQLNPPKSITTKRNVMFPRVNLRIHIYLAYTHGRRVFKTNAFKQTMAADYDRRDALRPHFTPLARVIVISMPFSFYLANMNKNKDTPKYAVAVYIQTLNDSGFKNQNSCGCFFSGFAYSMLMPNVMNGVVKSTAVLRSKVIVKSHIARSARCETDTHTPSFRFVETRANRYQSAARASDRRHNFYVIFILNTALLPLTINCKSPMIPFHLPVLWFSVP